MTRIIVSGASGLIGQMLIPELRAKGHQVSRLVRRAASEADEVFWNPAKGELDPARIEGVDVIINLAGENIAAGRWTAARRERILRSRVDATRTLVVAMSKLARKPRIFISASAAGFYGDRGDDVLTEESGIGHGFLSEVCLAWETHAEGAARNGIRTVLMRLGMVLAAEGGALKKMLPVFRMGLGGRFGDGEQWMSWVAASDVIGAFEHAFVTETLSGPINLTAPEPVTNTEFTRTLAATLGRPAFLNVPRWALRLALGRMADEALLTSTRVQPRRLIETGYEFKFHSLAPALEQILAG